MQPSHYWHDRHVIITGASSGIGRALALHTAALGARVGLIARRGDALAAVVAEIGKQSDEATKRRSDEGGQTGTAMRAAAAVADVCDPAALRAAVAQLTAALGPCDVIVANAGVHGYTPGFALNSDEFARVWATNVQGVVNTLAAVLPDMVARRRGHVVTIASLAGLIGLPDVGAYCASKAALITLMQSLRVDLHPYGVGVTTVCPGFVDTPFIAGHDRRVMKFMVSADDAARRIARAVARGAGTCVFPWQTWLMTQIGRWLPFPLYRRVIAGAVRRTP